MSKVEVWNNVDTYLEAFNLHFTPIAGGADVILEFGFVCSTTMNSIAITKPVVAVTNAGSKPTFGFIFHYADGTTTQTSVFPANRDTSKDAYMELCGNFIGLKCSFDPVCRRRLNDQTFGGRKLSQ